MKPEELVKELGGQIFYLTALWPNALEVLHATSANISDENNARDYDEVVETLDLVINVITETMDAMVVAQTSPTKMMKA